VTLPSGLDQGFSVAAGELGMCSAAWLYCELFSAEGGDDLVGQLRDVLGRAFPVLDAVAELWLSGQRGPELNVDAAREVCSRAERVVVVGLESRFLDPLVEGLGTTRCALLCHSAFDADWERVLSNYRGRLERVDLDGFQAWAGPDSVLLTFAYGVQQHSTHVAPAWVRASGEDVRTQFRSLLAWDVLGAPMFVYPRWLVEVPLHGFTEVI
jgi:hypothetical protein